MPQKKYPNIHSTWFSLLYSVSIDGILSIEAKDPDTNIRKLYEEIKVDVFPPTICSNVLKIKLYRQAIMTYINQRSKRKPTWSTVYDAKVGLMMRPFDVPDLVGIPEDYLPLMAVSWTTAAQPHLLAIHINGYILYAEISCSEEHGEAIGIEVYPDLKALFHVFLERCVGQTEYTQELFVNDLYALYLIESYHKLVVPLRVRFSKIAPLLIDAPDLPSDVRETCNRSVG